MIFNFEYELIRSKRKTLGIKITKDAKVKVLAPINLKTSYIENFLKEKEDWIETHLLEMCRKKLREILFHLMKILSFCFTEKSFRYKKQTVKKQVLTEVVSSCRIP